MKLEIKKNYTDWLVLLKDLSKGTLKLDYTQQAEIEKLAADWPSCACGQLCSTLPRDGEGAPRDRALYQLGVDFNDYVSYQEWANALNTFKEIESRSTRLLNEQAVKDAQDRAAKILDLEAKKAKLQREINSLR